MKTIRIYVSMDKGWNFEWNNIIHEISISENEKPSE